jgi:hypothetical protein
MLAGKDGMFGYKNFNTGSGERLLQLGNVP